ncbi:MAG TPA: DegV family protein [Syntrophomonadaceae bacterium]|nr:DegV family protein [Syntrophomonadaceae bacterium]
MSIKIVTDSTAYLTADLQKEYDLTIVPLSVIFPDESFKETEVDYDYFYSKIDREGIIPTSSQPSQGEMEDAFNRLIDEGHEIMAIFISGDLSGTCQSAYGARQAILQANPTARIEILDSRTTCMAMGFIVLAAAQAAREGKSLEEVAAAARTMQGRTGIYFVPATLEYLKKGGRIGGAAALLGSLLQIKPILYLSNGKVDVLEKARGTKAALETIFEVGDRECQARGLSQAVVVNVVAVAKAAELAAEIRRRYGLEAPIAPIGPVIGLHVGPGTLGIVYVTQRD